MKKADNFDPSKWLVENKITFQSRLNENEDNEFSQLLKDLETDLKEYDAEEVSYDTYIPKNNPESPEVNMTIFGDKDKVKEIMNKIKDTLKKNSLFKIKTGSIERNRADDGFNVGIEVTFDIIKK